MKAKDLKNSILQMAVEGKLVPQDPADEPASVLLDRIREEKHKLIAEGKAKFPKGGESIIYIGSDGSPYEKRVDAKGRVLSEKCIAEEVPFDLADGWAWVRLEDCCINIVDCPHSTPHYLTESTGFTAIDTNCMDDNWTLTELRNLSKESYEKRVTRYIPIPGDIVFSREGSIGRSVILNSEQTCLGQRVMLLHCNSELLFNLYCQVILSSPYAWSLYLAANVGTGVKHINVSMVKTMLVPLPPLPEQRRIVECVEELMPLIEEYGKLEDAREELDEALPDRLRKSVLQMAVQGKLVPQDSDDEPASVLLECIREQRRQLIAEKKMKAPKGGESVIFTGSDGRRYEKRVDAKGRESEPVCIEDEIPFDIPESWEWTRLGSVSVIHGGATPDKGNPKYWGGTLCWASMKDIHGDVLDETLDHITQEGLDSKASISVCRPGDLVVSTRLIPGKSIISRIDSAINQDLKIVRSDAFEVTYLHLWFQSMLEKFKRVGSGTTVPGIKLEQLSSVLIPVPPRAEQRRIAEQFELLALHMN